MYLKRLEIQGFKSFPDKIKIEFDRGITAIVGPNGSGKSNISDAVSWVLGEQSAKSLRGLKMEDIIFSGTQRRQGRSFAEVVMVLDNSDLKLHLSYTEVSVTRRMYRSGESEFYINSTACRLKDIHQLFTDTGLGKDGYSIISQGRVDEILSVRSEDRRVLFEEAAGILKFKNRKLEASHRIERERVNLERVSDIISELETQLAPLERQAKAAEKYLGLKEYLKLLQINIFRDESEKKTGQTELMIAKLNGIMADLELEESKQRVNSLDILRVNSELEENERQLEAMSSSAASLKSLIISKENDVKLMEERLTNANANLDRLSAEIAGKVRKLERIDIEIEYINESGNKLQLELAEKMEALSKSQENYDKLADLTSEEKAISEYNAKIIDKIKQISDMKAELKLKESMYEQYGYHREELDEEKEGIENQLFDRRNSLSENLSRKIALEKDCNSLESTIAYMEGENKAASARMSAQAGILADIIRRKETANTKLSLLSAMEREREGYYGSVKAVLKWNGSGIRGTVGELLYVAKKYESAIEAALGASIQNVVTNTEEDAGRAIEFLKKSKSGRVTFMPLSSVKARELGMVRDSLLNEPGVLGTAKSLISYSSEYENIYSSLLGSVIAVDTMEHALIISRKYRNAYRLVTLQGEIFSPGGAMTGGSFKNSSALVSRSREIAELKASVDELEKLEEKEMSLSAEYAAEAEKISNHLTLAKEELREKRIELTGVAMLAEQLAEAAKILQGRAQAIELDVSKVMKEIVIANKYIRDLKSAVKTAEDEVEGLKLRLEDYQGSLTNRREMKDLRVSELSSLASDVKEIEQMLKASTDSLMRLNEQKRELENELKLQEAQVETNEQSSKQFSNSIEVLKNEVFDTVEAFEKKSAELVKLDEFMTDIRKRKSSLEGDEKEIGELIANIKSEKFRAELKKEQLDEEVRRLHDEMWENYKITRQMANEYEVIDMTPAQLQREERKIRNEISQMGDINVNSIEACKELKKRHEFLKNQRNDIVEAERKLTTIARELTKMMEERFLQQFEEISYNFSFVFKEMFGGGDAKVKLSDENNPLESGIDIIAQPPGKSLQNMMLLSGGERTLTAIALLFGILRIKPSPFCVLDEIEAALDEANTARYAKYIKSVSRETQLILVTHKQLTMESADVMYGVTMQEQGVSKVIPIKFEEAANELEIR